MIDTSNWKTFKLCGEDGLFQIESCKCSNAGDLLEEGCDIEYIGAKKEDNGVMSFAKYNSSLVTKGNCIVFICDGQGSVGYTNYIDHDFIGSTTVSVGYNNHLNTNIGLFLVTILDLERYRYSFGRKYAPNLSKATIRLPAKNNEPDWEFMENYISSLGCSPIETSIERDHSLRLDTKDWKEFLICKLFNAEMGNGIDAILTTSVNPKYNYVSRDSSGNGVVGYVDEVDGECPFPAGAMSLALGGSYLGSCFIQTKPFYTAQNVAVLQEKEPLSNHVKLFIATLIRNECKVKYQAFGRELNAHYKKDFTIKLPVKHDENGIIFDASHEFSDEGYIPDWEWMENYMKSLPYSDRV